MTKTNAPTFFRFDFQVPPTLITNINSTSTAVQEEIFGPVLVAMSFRTAKEGIKLANNTRYGLVSELPELPELPELHELHEIHEAPVRPTL